MMETAESYRDEIQRVVDLLRESRSLLFITGAGISAGSGLPTYGGIGGLYAAGAWPRGVRAYQPMDRVGPLLASINRTATAPAPAGRAGARPRHRPQSAP